MRVNSTADRTESVRAQALRRAEAAREVGWGRWRAPQKEPMEPRRDGGQVTRILKQTAEEGRACLPGLGEGC